MLATPPGSIDVHVPTLKWLILSPFDRHVELYPGGFRNRLPIVVMSLRLFSEPIPEVISGSMDAASRMATSTALVCPESG